MISELIKASKAETIPEGSSGLWFIKKTELDAEKVTKHNGNYEILPSGIYTHLFRITESTLHLNPPGTVVMEDTPVEIRTHLSFMLRATGNILITGLGLGCVIRGLLFNPAVKHITCIEKSSDVLKLVAPYMPKERLTIIHADALEWTKINKFTFDYAWHDLWSDRDRGDPMLDVLHTQLIFNCIKKVKHQGAWRYARVARRYLKTKRINLIA